MADLDDFFAKRDKKKPKGKKFESTDDVAKILETKAKERKKQETIKSTYTAPLTEDGLPAQPTNEYRAQGDEDDEWKETVEAKPDYTGLKIGELVLNDDDSDLEGNEQDGRVGNDGSANDGPWSKNKALRSKNAEATPETAEAGDIEAAGVSDEIKNEEVQPDDTEVVGDTDTPKKYVPPSLRGTETGTTPKPASVASTEGLASTPSGAYVPPSRRGVGLAGPATATKPKKPTIAPDIDDTNYFPSLGS